MTTEAQFPAKLKPLFQPRRYKVLHGGRGGAKSWGVARALLIQGAAQPIRVLCAREFQNSIKDSVHKLLSDQIEALGLAEFYEIQATVIRGVNGTEFAFEGLRHNVTRIKSYEGVDRVWVEEAQTVSKSSWDLLIPTIRKPGSEIWITFNPEFEDDETFARFVLHPPASAWVCEINYRDNPWFPDVLEDERLELKARDPESYDHVWEGKCRRWLEGAIYATELRAAYDENRIGAVPHDPAIPVHTAWDIGRTDDTSIWWYQVAGRELHIIDCVSQPGGDPAHFASMILGHKVDIDFISGEVKVTHGAPNEHAHRAAYRYERHWLPHDAKAKTFAAQGKSTQQQLAAALGWGAVSITPNLDREDGIKVARSMFGRCYFDQNRCADGLRALRRYRRELQTDAVSLQRTPKHDWASHAADAFRYLAVAWREHSPPAPPRRPARDAWGRPEETETWKTNL